ncbi:hypothetical protein [Pseudohongiella spirulinae]|uniref:Secreted protein n=1 Tax=Pseudohongiella spirulinae TaxID=1249552 RepID=A0A0S2KDK3_9GAMM|nr:hypothetical protein [Pseudohongiella spirulinae]ALO46395.1 hypothetical protein PS2015_1744 [Pseudohongiella spirulinae]
MNTRLRGKSLHAISALISAFIMSLSLLVTTTAIACETPTGANVDAIFDGIQVNLRGCYGEDNDRSELTLWVRQELRKAEIPSTGRLEESHLQAVEAIVQRLANTVSSEAIRLENANLAGASAVRTVAERLRGEAPSQTTDALRQARDSDGGWQFALEEDRYGPSVNNVPLLQPINTILTPNCQAQPASDGCQQATESLEQLLRVANLMQQVNQRADRTLGINLHAFQRNNVMWDLYSNEARVQYPWEMLLNGHLYQSDIRQRERTSGRELALVDRIPPERQIILLHPSIGMEYVDEASDGSRFEPAVVMEWIGFNTWKFAGSGTDVRMRRPLGVSLITTYSDRDGSKNVGHGLALHWNNKLTTGLSWRSDGDIGVFISIGLADRFSSEKSRLEKVLGWLGR